MRKFLQSDMIVIGTEAGYTASLDCSLCCVLPKVKQFIGKETMPSSSKTFRRDGAVSWCT